MFRTRFQSRKDLLMRTEKKKKQTHQNVKQFFYNMVSIIAGWGGGGKLPAEKCVEEISRNMFGIINPR